MQKKYKDEKSASYTSSPQYYCFILTTENTKTQYTIRNYFHKNLFKCEFGCVAFSHFDRWLSLSGHGEHHKACAKYGLCFPYLLSLSST